MLNKQGFDPPSFPDLFYGIFAYLLFGVFQCPDKNLRDRSTCHDSNPD